MRLPRQIESHQRLLDSIVDDTLQASVKKILRVATGALGALSRLDHAIFERRSRNSTSLLADLLVRGEAADVDVEQAADFLLALADSIWEPAEALVESTRGALGGSAHSAESDDMDIDLDSLDFDAGFSESASESDPMRPTSDDIDGALDVLGGDAEKRPRVRIVDVALAVSPLADALEQHVGHARGRIQASTDEKNLRRALQELDESRGIMGEAIFAIIESVFRAFHLHLPRTDLLPGYRSALEEALSIRQSRAVLHRAVREANTRVQDTDADADERDEALAQVTQLLGDFVDGDVFRYMRAADRWELLGFRDDLEGKDASSGRLICEGLTKYLESLGAISQREVIVQHDREVCTHIADNLEAAEPLLGISAHGAADLVIEALIEATSLRGWREDLDELLDENERDPLHPDDTDAVRARLEKLDAMLPKG
jgi:hypothetical protein